MQSTRRNFLRAGVGLGALATSALIPGKIAQALGKEVELDPSYVTSDEAKAYFEKFCAQRVYPGFGCKDWYPIGTHSIQLTGYDGHLGNAIYFNGYDGSVYTIISHWKGHLYSTVDLDRPLEEPVKVKSEYHLAHQVHGTIEFVSTPTDHEIWKIDGFPHIVGDYDAGYGKQICVAGVLTGIRRCDIKLGDLITLHGERYTIIEANIEERLCGADVYFWLDRPLEKIVLDNTPFKIEKPFTWKSSRVKDFYRPSSFYYQPKED